MLNCRIDSNEIWYGDTLNLGDTKMLELICKKTWDALCCFRTNF